MRDGAGTSALRRRKLLVLDVRAEDIAGVLRHRAIEEDRNVRQPARRFQALEVIHQALRTPHRERRDDHGTAAADRRFRNFGQSIGRIALVVVAIAIGRFDEQVIGPFNRLRIEHDGIGVSPEITGEGDRGARPIELDRGGSENMAGMAKTDAASTRKRTILIEGNERQMFKNFLCILQRVERQRRLVFRKAMAIRELGILFLEVSGIGQKDFTKIGSCFGTEDAPCEPLFDQQGEVARVIDMRVRQDNGFDTAWLDRKWLPVLQPQCLEALKQPAVDENAMRPVFDKVLRSGNRTGASQECEV